MPIRSTLGLLRSMTVCLAVFLAVGLKMAEAKTTCLFEQSGNCELKVDHSGFRIQVDERGQIVVVFGSNPAEIARGDSYVRIHEDLVRLVETQAYSENETEKITADLMKLDGAVYSIPEADDLRLSLNFPTGASFGAKDFYDLVQVHLQLVLSVSVLTANYLAELTGLATLESAPAPSAVPAQVTPPTLAPTEAPPELPQYVPPAPTADDAGPTTIPNQN